MSGNIQVEIAEIKKDIKYMSDAIDEAVSEIKAVRRGMVTKDEYLSTVSELREEHKTFMTKEVINAEIEPLKKIIWVAVLGIISAFLNSVFEVIKIK